jgi:hypothetical protein
MTQETTTSADAGELSRLSGTDCAHPYQSIVAGTQSHRTEFGLQLPSTIGALREVDEINRIEDPPLRERNIRHHLPPSGLSIPAPRSLSHASIAAFDASMRLANSHS